MEELKDGLRLFPRIYKEEQLIWCWPLVIIILLMKHCKVEEECLDCDALQEKIDNIEQKIKDKDCLDCDWENIDNTENDTN